MDPDGTLQGILSIDDVVLRSEEKLEKNQSSVSFGDAVQTLKAIYGVRPQRRRRIVPTS